MLDVRQIPKLKNRKPLQIKLDSFNGGVNTLLSETRIKTNEAKEATNLMLIEDGVWTKRWGTEDYGTALSGTIDGAHEYVATDGTRELIVIDAGTPKKSTDDGVTWTTITGGTFTAGNQCYFHQIGVLSGGSIENRLYIVNGVDNLAYYDGTQIQTYSSLSAPAWAATPLAKTGLTGTNYTYYYQVTAVNDVGETLTSSEQSIQVGDIRDNWDGSNYVTLDWNAVTGATKYLIYVSDLSGHELYLDETTDTQYDDKGQASPNSYIEPPLDNTTAGPILKTITSSGGRLWGVDTENKIWFSGSTASEKGTFGIHTGGGWVGIERGSRATATTVVDFQGKPHVFMKYPEGKGQIWEINETTVTVGSVDVTVMIPNKILDATGTEAVGSVVHVENDVFYWDNGVRVLGNEPGVLNVLRTNELSSRVRPYVTALTADSEDKVTAFYWDSKVLFSVPRNSSTPDRIIVYDRERLAWFLDWTIGVSQFLLYTDTDGKTRLLGVSGSKLIEFSSNYEADSGTAFNTRYISPRIAISDKDFTQWAKIFRAYLRLRNTLGTVNVTITGTGKSEAYSSLATETITPGSSNSGLSWDQMSDFQLSDSNGTPSSYQNESLIKRIKVNKLVRDIQITLETSGVGDKFTLIGVLFEGLPVDTGDPTSWRE